MARAFEAKTTPDVFVIDADGRLRYRGAPDADHQDPSLDAEWLRDALNCLRAAEDVARRRDRSDRLQRQVEAVIARIAASVSLRS